MLVNLRIAQKYDARVATDCVLIFQVVERKERWSFSNVLSWLSGTHRFSCRASILLSSLAHWVRVWASHLVTKSFTKENLGAFLKEKLIQPLIKPWK